ncbi:hypothetical protein [Variovorax sp. RO1]|uniref:hypothetical protein n=1 Tax=Variovorax sp. RO1 TaxID=2066034 RepID=UPI00117DA249|nr:hypothetical protein [Variovorax sp. RO1]
MSIRKMGLVFGATAAALLSFVSSAQFSAQHVEGPSHFAATEEGVKQHPEMTGKQRTEAEVAAELRAAQTNPDWAGVLRWGAPIPIKNAGVPKTRAEVIAELERAQTHPSWDRATRYGAPLVMPAAPGSTVNGPK